MAAAQRHDNLRNKFIQAGGQFDDAWESVLLLDPNYFEVYTNWMAVPAKNRHLPKHIQELVHICVSAAATHLHKPGIRHHVRAALQAGASAAEINEVLELTSTLGIHACNIGIPLLRTVLVENGSKKAELDPLDDYQRGLKADFINNRGYWNAFWDEFLELDPDFFGGYMHYSSISWQNGPLEPKYKELIYCAFDAAATHLYVPGLKVHMQNALSLGATAQQILEVLEIASLLSAHTFSTAAPIVLQELGRHGRAPESLGSVTSTDAPKV